MHLAGKKVADLISEDDISRFVKEYHARYHKHLVEDFDEFDLYLIKCHIFIEREITEYIQRVTKNRLNLDAAGFSFIHKVKIARLLGLFDTPETLKKLELFLYQINTIRNSIAHKFQSKENEVKQLFELVSSIDNSPAITKAQKGCLDVVITRYSALLMAMANLQQSGKFHKV